MFLRPEDKNYYVSRNCKNQPTQNVLQGKAGQISDGFHLSEFVLADKSSFILSPDKFGNYTPLLLAIRRNLDRLHP